MKARFFKIVEDSKTLEIIELFQGGAVGYIAGDISPVTYQPGEVIHNALEISKHEFDKLLITWVDEKNDKLDEMSLKRMKQSVAKLEFKPITKFLVTYDNIQIEGFSTRTTQELNQFVQSNPVGGILILNRKGEPKALLRSSVLQRASFIY